MKRRDFFKVTALVPATGALLSVPRITDAATASAPATQGGGSAGGPVPDFAEHMLTTDMNGIGPDGKPTGQTATFTGASKAGATAKSASVKMKLTAEEQAILDGKEGPEKAKLMQIMVRFGETFGATKMVDLGGAPHSNLFIGAPYMESIIDMLNECADAGLKSYAPYTVNPRPYDVYNVQNNPKDMEMIYQGYPLQMKLDYVHSKLGAPDLNYRSCACYTDDVGNKPEPGTYVAWCESSAVNYGKFYSPDYDALHAQAAEQRDVDKRAELLRQAEMIAVESTSGPDFLIDRYELTNEQFAAFVEHPSAFPVTN